MKIYKKAYSQNRKSASLLSKIIIPMIILSMFQVIIMASAMWFTGEFKAIKRFSYESISEKTENRRNYVENTLNRKTSPVHEAALEVNEITNGILADEGLDASAILSNKELNKRILSECAESLISLIRRDTVNDAFIILNSGELYNVGSQVNMASIYLRDTDTNENNSSGNSDIYMEAGSSETAHDLGLPLDFEWSLHIDMTDHNDFSFFYDTMAGCSSYPNISTNNLGMWSGFSGISGSTQQSMKYTIPLVAEDGTVYGVIGIGLLKKTLLQAIPSNDFFDDSSCYILGTDLDDSGTFEIQLSSGPAYGRLVKDDTVLSRNNPTEFELYDFSSSGADCLGSIQELTLYNSGSPYKQQKWALISVADKNMTLSAYTSLVRIFVISVIVTLIVGVVFAYLVSRGLSRPVTEMVNVLEENYGSGELVKLGSSGITEIDNLARSITELQSDALGYSARVSGIITLAGGNIGVFMYDLRAKKVFVGESLIHLLKFSLPEKDATISEDKFHEELSTIDKDSKLLSLDIFSAFSEKKNDSLELMYETPIIKEPRWIKFNLARDNGNVVGLAQDITDTVKEKRRIAQVKDDEYTARLLEANAALRDAYAMAKQANNAKTDFLSRMSHDIRTPMNAIIGMTAIAEANLGDNAKIEDCLKKIGTSGEYLLSLINEVLDMSKIESGKFVLTEEHINIKSIIEGIVEIVKPSVKAKEHELKVNIGELPHENVIGDGVRIQQALVNILSNAIKYTPPGGHIEFSVCEKPVNQTKVGCYEFIIKDNGIGMSEEFLKKIYDPFERASDVRVNKEHGTGLGMAITKNIVEMMDGSIQVQSELMKGSTFKVTIVLKLDKEKSDENNAIHTKNLNELKGGFEGNRVLLVDDNELNREIACEILEMAGLTVDTAEDGKEAVKKFEASGEGYYKMIFMDIQMPIMNGYEATEAIRALSKSDAKTVPIIAMTANAFAEDVQDAKNSGMNEHIAKPLDLNRLIQTLDKYLG